VLSGQTPVIRMLAIAARGSPVLFDSWSLVHEDLVGTVKGWGQTGLLPDGSEAADPARPRGRAALGDRRDHGLQQRLGRLRHAGRE
jgi:hypothetical protein